jgi:hypothetical protein
MTAEEIKQTVVDSLSVDDRIELLAMTMLISTWFEGNTIEDLLSMKKDLNKLTIFKHAQQAHPTGLVAKIMRTIDSTIELVERKQRADFN